MISEDKKTVTSKSGETFMVTDRYAENHWSAVDSWLKSDCYNCSQI